MSGEHSVFWDDLAQDLTDPQFLREYVAESVRVATIDRIVNELDAAREVAGLSKAQLARAINSEPATVRRLFSSGHVNPTLGTLAEVAAALGMRVVLEPLGAHDRQQITEPLLAGSTGGPPVLAGRLDAARRERNGSTIRLTGREPAGDQSPARGQHSGRQPVGPPSGRGLRHGRWDPVMSSSSVPTEDQAAPRRLAMPTAGREQIQRIGGLARLLCSPVRRCHQRAGPVDTRSAVHTPRRGNGVLAGRPAGSGAGDRPGIAPGRLTGPA